MSYGLLGRKLGHSYSPQIHGYLGSYTYNLFEKEPEDVGAFLRSGGFSGLNVTMPYKKDVIPYCDELTPIAEALGAVNTIVRRDDGKIVGHNTDYFGFTSMVNKSGLTLKGKKVLVLGSGGASATAVYVCSEMGAQVIVISRSGENNYTNLHLHADASVIVNATPVGMYPNNGISPVDLGLFPSLEGVLDMIYNPARTALLMQAKQRGLIAENGLWMLVAQAKESAEWFTGEKIDDSLIKNIHNILSKQMMNIVLIGMPGCGKSSIGRLIAQKTGRVFIDADAEIEFAANMSIPEIFTKQQESGFRAIETQVLEMLGKASGAVIATGGGCVTRPENYPLLHQNSTIIWIRRDVSLLPTDGRPLSQANDLVSMYQYRMPLYEAFADFTVENQDSLDNVAEEILSLY